MAAEAQHLGRIQLDATTGGALTDYTSAVLNATINWRKNTSEYHTLGTFWAKQAEGGGSAEVDIEGLVDPTASTLHGVLRTWFSANGERTFEAYTGTGTGAGHLKISGEVILADLSPVLPTKGGAGDVKTFKAKLRFSGTVTEAVTV